MIPPKKSLGQNFLADSGTARRIVSAVGAVAGDLVVEIGPGTGALTRLLAESSGYVVAIEVDRRLTAALRQAMEMKNLSVVEADVLTVALDSLLDECASTWNQITGLEAPPRVRVVANLPYYISTPIIERLIGLRDRIFDMTLMLQKEVVERIVSPPGSRDYGYLSVLVQFYCEAAKLFDVPPEAFRPAPKVHSAILRLVVRKDPAVRVPEETRFFAVVRAAFAQRRKTIANNLKAAARVLGLETNNAESRPVRQIWAALKAAGIDPMRRAETLSLDEFAILDRALYQNLS